MKTFHLGVMLCLALVPLSCTESCNGGEETRNIEDTARQNNIVLIGATGDLAKKYLWNGLFRLFRNHYDEKTEHFTIYACSRKDPDKGREALSQILLNTVRCSDSECRSIKTRFVEATQYHQLKTAKHYEQLGDKINENTQSRHGLQDTDFSSETGRIVYLAIPPASYAATAKLVHKHLRSRIGHPYFRLVLEKPFGHDLNSAQKLVDSLAENYNDNEIYRVDHYLGKAVVGYMLPFRQLNKAAYDKLWTHEHIERVEIVMKETVDVKGRLAFYDDVGVMRDVMQNHLTELLALVAMETPADSSHIGPILRNKLSLLRQTRGTGVTGSLIGQYGTYVSEAVNELKEPARISTRTATFAATLLRVDNARWAGVPFIMVAGKKLDEKASYVRLVFKQSHFCVARESCEERRAGGGGGGQIVFVIGTNDVRSPPMVIVSRTLPEPRASSGWKLLDSAETANIGGDAMLFGVNVSDAYVLVPDDVHVDAYCTLIEAVYGGQRHLFTDTALLLAAWRLWDPIRSRLDGQLPRSYEGGSDVGWLDFTLQGTSALAYVTDDDFSELFSEPHVLGMPTSFREQPLVAMETTALLQTLSDVIYERAASAADQHRQFHVALSGGRRTPDLLAYLATKQPMFPWQHTHVWMVDERCVQSDDARSNFRTIERDLLRNLPAGALPYSNVHRMPVQLAGALCNSDSAATYQAELELLTNGTLDLVVLGVGTDGHTASLFPGSHALQERQALVTLTDTDAADGGPSNGGGVAKRMTLTLRALNEARHVAVLVTGAEKHDLIETLSAVGDDPVKYPITGVKADVVEWYVDYQAWHGNKQ